jgi:hypothetical protein
VDFSQMVIRMPNRIILLLVVMSSEEIYCSITALINCISILAPRNE